MSEGTPNKDQAGEEASRIGKANETPSEISQLNNVTIKSHSKSVFSKERFYFNRRWALSFLGIYFLVSALGAIVIDTLGVSKLKVEGSAFVLALILSYYAASRMTSRKFGNINNLHYYRAWFWASLLGYFILLYFPAILAVHYLGLPLKGAMAMIALMAVGSAGYTADKKTIKKFGVHRRIF